MLGRVAIVGRPNVGKSTLFNRLVGRRVAIVHPQPGVTRDRLVAPVRWRGQLFEVVDTGGLLEARPGEGLTGAVWAQAAAALREARLIVFLVDAREGLLPGDRELGRWLRTLGKPCLLVANKADTPVLEAAAQEFAALGLGEPVPVSAANGRNIGELLDRILHGLGESAPGAAAPERAGGGAAQIPADEGQAPVRIAIVGRPNVGKSALVNAIVGEERVAVDQQAGTTRDAVDVSLAFRGRAITLVDTAGIRRKARPGAGDLEQLAVSRALEALRRADVAVVVVDATEGVAFQEARLAGRAAALGVAVVIAVNKWDRVVATPSRPVDSYIPAVQQAAARLYWAPVYFVSALRGWNVAALVEGALAAADRRRAQLDPEALRETILEAQGAHPPPARGRTGVRIAGVRQVRSAPPTLALRLRGKGELPDSYLRYLENRLRARFDLRGTPVRWVQVLARRPVAR